MESVKETINSATGAVTNTIYGSGTQTQEHKSMIDDHVSKGIYSGKVETTKDAMNTDGIEPSDPSKTRDDQASGSSQGTSKGLSGPAGMGSPQGANVTGHDTNADTNKDAMSNKDEPNRGFGGGGGKGSSAEPSVSAGGAGNMGQPKLPDEKSSEEGTGTQYVKSTGLKADGGDFDASRPGAGREADRLLEQAGIHHGPGGGTAGQSAHGSVSDPPKEQHKGLGEKIKDKLHH